MKGVPMNRSLLVLALFAFAAPAYSITASVTSSTAPATSATTNSTTAATKSATTNAAPDTRPGTASAAPTKSTAPNAASVTRPAATLSAPGVPMKSTAVLGARPGVAPSKATVPMPGVTSPAGSVAPAPTNAAAWAATAAAGSGMHRGTLDAINAGAGTFQVHGQKLTFNPQQVKVFNRDGTPGSVFGLKNGANIRFTLDAADTKNRRVAVIYVN
jgi:hypothetical protein